MTWIRLFLISSVLICFSFLAQAQDTIQLHHIPKGIRCSIVDNRANCYDDSPKDTFQCFNFDEYKELVAVDVKLESLLKLNLNLEDNVTLLESKVASLQLDADLQNKKIGIVLKENDRLFENWKEENKQRHLAEAKPMLGDPILWAVIGVEAVVIAIFAVGTSL